MGRIPRPQPRQLLTEPSAWPSASARFDARAPSDQRRAAEQLARLCRHLERAITEAGWCTRDRTPRLTAFARAHGLSPTVVTRLLAGRTWPDFVTLSELCHLAGVPLLAEDRADPAPPATQQPAVPNTASKLVPPRTAASELTGAVAPALQPAPGQPPDPLHGLSPAARHAARRMRDEWQRSDPVALDHLHLRVRDVAVEAVEEVEDAALRSAQLRGYLIGVDHPVDAVPDGFWTPEDIT